MKGGIVPEFSSGKPTAPLLGSVGHDTTQVHLHALIHALALAVCLRVVSRAQRQLCSRILEEFLLKVAGEDRVTIRHNGRRETMDPIYAVHVEEGHFR